MSGLARDEVLRIAIRSGVICGSRELVLGVVERLECFASLAYAAGQEAEREACAKVCDEQAKEPECPERAAYCAAAIRARGDK